MWTRMELLHLALKQKPFFSPGSKDQYHYTNTDYFLAGMVIESVTDQPVEESMTRIFKLANLTPDNIYYPSLNHPIPLEIKQRIPQSYVPDNADLPALWMDTYRAFPEVQIPGSTPIKAYQVSELDSIMDGYASTAGAIASNTPTIVNWIDAIFSNKIINQKSLDQWLTGIKTNQGFQYGLGITIGKLKEFNQTLISHDGSLLGYTANMVMLKPSNIIIAVATNSNNNAVSIDGEIMIGLLTILERRQLI